MQLDVARGPIYEGFIGKARLTDARTTEPCAFIAEPRLMGHAYV